MCLFCRWLDLFKACFYFLVMANSISLKNTISLSTHLLFFLNTLFDLFPFLIFKLLAVGGALLESTFSRVLRFPSFCCDCEGSAQTSPLLIGQLSCVDPDVPSQAESPWPACCSCSTGRQPRYRLSLRHTTWQQQESDRECDRPVEPWRTRSRKPPRRPSSSCLAAWPGRCCRKHPC